MGEDLLLEILTEIAYYLHSWTREHSIVLLLVVLLAEFLVHSFLRNVIRYMEDIVDVTYCH